MTTHYFNDDDRPSYFAIIPGDVRYCDDLEMGAKLMYGEISALTCGRGFCEPSSRYFAELYGVESKNIESWLQSLIEAGFVTVNDKKIFLTIEDDLM